MIIPCVRYPNSLATSTGSMDVVAANVLHDFCRIDGAARLRKQKQKETLLASKGLKGAPSM